MLESDQDKRFANFKDEQDSPDTDAHAQLQKDIANQ
jgi:hypothetical protein